MPEPSPQRDARLDFFRGVALIFIFIDHVPRNVLSYFTLQAIGFYDAAEVFIFISGFTAALVYGRRLASKGVFYAVAQVWRRAWQLYVAHVFLFVLFIAEVSYTSSTFKNPMFAEEMRVASFLDEPHVAVVKALLLEFQPAFLDILPMYIVMMLIFPAVLLGLRRHWLIVLLPSVLLYLAVQVFDISVLGYPAGHVWFFNPLAWQFLFVSGAVLADRTARGACFGGLLKVVYPLAVAVFAAATVVRLSWTLHGLWDSIPALFVKPLWPVDKNNLSPIRVVPFFALVVLVAVHVPRDARFLSSRVARPFVICGQQSLEIFCLGILLAALGHFMLAQYGFNLALKLAIDAAGIVTMIVTARMINWYKTVDRLPVLQPAAARGAGEGAG